MKTIIAYVVFTAGVLTTSLAADAGNHVPGWLSIPGIAMFIYGAISSENLFFREYHRRVRNPPTSSSLSQNCSISHYTNMRRVK